MTYNVFVGTLSLTLSINQWACWCVGVFQWTSHARLSLDCVAGLATGHMSTVTSPHHTTPVFIHVSYQLLITLHCFVCVNPFKDIVICHNQKFILGCFLWSFLLNFFSLLFKLLAPLFLQPRSGPLNPAKGFAGALLAFAARVITTFAAARYVPWALITPKLH